MKYLIAFSLGLSFFWSACKAEQQYSITRSSIITNDFRYSVIDVACANEKIVSSILEKKYGDVQIFIVPKALYYDIVIVQFQSESKITFDLIDRISEDVKQLLNEARRNRLEKQKMEEPEGKSRKEAGFAF